MRRAKQHDNVHLHCEFTGIHAVISVGYKYQKKSPATDLECLAGIVLAALISWRRLQRKRYRKLSSKESNETPLEEIIVKHS